MNSMKYDPKADSGVTYVASMVTDELQWIFREQPKADFGIDAQVEMLMDDGSVTGLLLALQIKAGASYFKEPKADGWIYRPAEKHVTYWQNHCLPVIIILVDVEHKKAYWQVVSDRTLTKSKKDGWKVLIPKQQELSVSTAAVWRKLMQHPGRENQYRRNVLSLALPWMKIAQSEGGLWMEAEQWINKSSGRSSLRLFTKTSTGEQTIKEWPFVMLPGWKLPEAIEHHFPWAILQLDQDFYEKHYESEHPFGTEPVFDDETGEFLFDVANLNGELENDFFDADDLRPYDVSSGELAMYRFRMQLNDLGNAFFTVERFLNG